MATFKFWVFRHAPVVDSSRIYGHEDLLVKNYNVDTVQLKNLKIPRDCEIISSLLKRAIIAIEDIKSHLGLKASIQFDNRLMEQNFGDLENSETKNCV